MQKPDPNSHPLDLFRFCPKCGSPRFEVHNEKSKSCPDCGFVYYFNPSAATAVFVTDMRHNLLVAVRGKDPAKGTFDLPGGFIDCYETAREGAARELLEETGIDFNRGRGGGVISPLKYLFSVPNIYPYSGFVVHTLDLFFHLEVDTLAPYIGEGRDDVAELLAIPLGSTTPELFGLPSVKTAIQKVLENHLI